MTTTELKSRIQQADEKIQKKQTTIAKKEKWILSGNKNQYEIQYLQDDIKRLHSEISETQTTVEKYQKQLSNEIAREETFLKDIPESMKQLQVELVDRWNTYDIDNRNNLKAKYKELGYSAFMKQYKHTGYTTMQLSDNDIIKENEKSAKALIIDLYYRINHITGDITNWNDVHCSGNALNGIVTGKEGRAKIETILAGGYNIQRLHIRVLVHSI
jgi:chromosome segregation ATPase